MIKHQFGYTSIIFEKMYYGEFVDSENSVLNLRNTLGYYNAESIADLETLIYEYFRVKDFNFNDLLSNKEIDARNLLEQKIEDAEKTGYYEEVDEISVKTIIEGLPMQSDLTYSPIISDFLPQILVEKESVSNNMLERTIKNLLSLEKKRIVKRLIYNAEVQKNDADAMFMMGPLMYGWLEYMQFSSELIEELKVRTETGETIIQWQFGDLVKTERKIYVKESLAVFSYFRCVLFELYQEVLLLFGDVLNRDNKRKSYEDLYYICFGHNPLEKEYDSYKRVACLYQTEKQIALYDKETALSLLNRIYSLCSKYIDDEQLQKAILRLENRIYFAEIQYPVNIASQSDWDYLHSFLLKMKREILEQIESETNSRKIVHLLEEQKNQLQAVGFINLPGYNQVNIEFSIVRNLEHWIKDQYDFCNNRISEYMPAIGSDSLNAVSEIRAGYKKAEMKKKTKDILQYMSGNNKEHELIMVPSDFQYMMDSFYYFIEYGCAPESIKVIDCKLNIGVISYTFYILYKLIYPNDSSKRDAWLIFICALFRNLPTPDELYNNYSRRSEEFLKYYFVGDKDDLVQYIRNH